MDMDSGGNLIFADHNNNMIRKIDPSGIITTIAGTGTPGFSGDGGPALQAQISYPTDVSIDAGGVIYFAELYNSTIRYIDLDGTIHTLVGNGSDTGFSGDGGPAQDALMNRPYGLSVSPTGEIAIADRNNQRIRKIGLPRHTISGIPGDLDVGAHAVTLTASDDEDATTLSFEVLIANVNDPPSIISAADAQAFEDQYFVFRGEANDVDSEDLEWRFRDIPPWLTADGDSLFGTPLEGDGDVTFWVRVSDGDLMDSMAVRLTVIPVDDPPQFTSADQVQAVEDVFFQYFAEAYDEEQAPLAFSFQSLPSWLSAVSDTLQGTPPNGALGSLVTVIVSDGFSNDTLEVDITVLPTNDTPQVIQSLGEVVMDEDEAGAILVNRLEDHFLDIDAGDSLTFIPTLLDTGMDSVVVSILAPDTSRLLAYPLAQFNGAVRVLIAAVDDSLAWISDTLTIHIQSVNDAPMLTSLPDTSFFEDQVLALPLSELYAYVQDDEDADTLLLWTFEGFGHLSPILTADSLLIHAETDWFGVDTGRVVVTDAGGLSDTAEVIVTVHAVNDAPRSFALLTPADLTVISEPDSVDLTLRWEASVDVDSEALSYELQFSSAEWDSSFSSILTSSVRLNIEAFPRGDTLRWTCQVSDGEWLTQATGTFRLIISETVGLKDVAIIPDDFELNQNYPNPFNPFTTIRYGIPEVADVNLVIYDLRGRTVRSWRLISQAPGWHEQVWDGLNASGSPVTTGVYFTRMTSGRYSKVIKMLYLK